MSNMSYCRFHNTLQDLRDCYEAWDEETSPEEEKEKARLLKLCEKIVADYGEGE
jgi:hypothetical protein